MDVITSFGANALSACTSGFNSFMEFGTLATLTDLLLNKSYAEDIPTLLGNTLSGIPSQFTPRLLSDIRQAFDREKRNTYYYDKNKSAPKWMQHIIADYQSTFGDREQLPAKIDEWGNSEGEQDDVKRAIESLISPAKWYREERNEVEKMLDQLDAKVDKNVFPASYPKEMTADGKKIYFSGKEYEEVAREIGKERYSLLKELSTSSDFKKLSADEKAEMIQDVYTVATEMAKSGFSDRYIVSTLTANLNEAKKSGLKPSSYLLAKQAYENMSGTDKAQQFVDYLTSNTKTSAKEDVKLLELVTRKKDGKGYKSSIDSAKTLPDATDEEILQLYVLTKVETGDGDKQRDIDSYMLMGYSASEALARYNVADNAKATFGGLTDKQQEKATKLITASKNGKTTNEWTEEKVIRAASAVTSIGKYGTTKTQKTYIAMLKAVGFTEREAKEFYKYYA